MNTFQKYFPQVQYLKKKNQAYLDNAATTLKPQCVIDTLTQFYTKQVSNVHRGDHALSMNLTTYYENTRTIVQKWIAANSSNEIIFTKSTTESLNLLSFSLENFLNSGDSILLTEMDHHSNILPWLALAKRKNLKIQFLPIDLNGELILSQLQTLDSHKIKLFCFPFYSNALGIKNPVQKLTAWAKKKNILTVIDAAQAMTTEPINVSKIDCDFLAFSGHKIFAPSGVGVLYVKEIHFPKLTPWQLGGGLVTDVSLSDYKLMDPPHCFEAGTPPIEEVLALGSVLDFLTQQNFFKFTTKHNLALLKYAEEQLKKIPGVQIIGESKTKINILSFIIQNIHCRDLGQLISQSGVAVRSGHHCCLPLMKKLKLASGTVRASFAAYNDEQDVDLLLFAVKKAKNILL